MIELLLVVCVVAIVAFIYSPYEITMRNGEDDQWERES